MSSVYIIAEAGVNHNGSIDIALEMVDTAAAAGADAVKFQSFKSEECVSRTAGKAEYQKRTTCAEESQLDMVRKLELGFDAHSKLVERAGKNKIEFLSTPFDLGSLDMLVRKFRVRVLKIASGEIVNGPLLLAAARAGTDIILSTGMSVLSEIEAALGVLAFGFIGKGGAPSAAAFLEAYKSEEGRGALEEKVALLHCTTEYPAPVNEANLKAMKTMREAFGLRTGFSDHTTGIEVALAAVAMGACVIEKHFTMSRGMEGPDHAASLEPAELERMVSCIRNVEAAAGDGEKRPTASEMKNIGVARKSLVASREIKMGQPFTVENITARRPGNGVSPIRYWEYIGKTAGRDYREDEQIDDVLPGGD